MASTRSSHQLPRSPSSCRLLLLLLASLVCCTGPFAASDEGSNEGTQTLGRVLELESELSSSFKAGGAPPPSASASAEQQAGDGRGADDVDDDEDDDGGVSMWDSLHKFMQEDNARLKAEELLQSIEQESRDGGAGVREKSTECVCFKVRHPEFARHVCVCSPMCWTGTKFVTIGEAQCKESSAEAGGEEVLQPVPCSSFEEAMNDALEAVDWYGFTLKTLTVRPQSWLRRRQRVDWRTGVTFLQILGRDGSSPFHFAARASTILLANDRSLRRFLPRVERFMFPRDPLTVQTQRVLGARSMSSIIFTVFLQHAMEALLGVSLRGSPQWKSHLWLGDHSMGYGLVELDDAWKDATSKAPLCFEHVVLASPLKSLIYPSGRAQVLELQGHMQGQLNLDAPPELPKDSPVRVLYITRLLGPFVHRRAITLESHTALLGLLQSKGFDVTVTSPTDVSLEKLFVQSQAAEIVISLHGGAMTNPGVLASPDTVVIELMPYHTEYTTYRMTSFTSSQIYIMKKLKRGPPQQGDLDVFEALDDTGCMSNMTCLLHYTHDRNVHIPPKDIEELGVVFDVASAIVGMRRSLPPSSSLVEIIGQKDPREWKLPNGQTQACQSCNSPCKQDLLTVMKAPKSYYECYL